MNRLDLRLQNKIEVQSDGCWFYTGYTMPNGYGQVRREGKAWLTHRWVYTQLVGPIPTGLDLDHLCRNRHCCNPFQCLEPVTRSENLKRAHMPNKLKVVCPSGHPYDYLTDKGSRWCKRCKSAYDKKRAEDRKLLVAA